MPDEVIYAKRAVSFYADGPWHLLRGQGSGYGFLYPAVAGIPLSLGSFSEMEAWLKPAQALLVSLAAVPVFGFCRRPAGTRYALIAAALTLASPLLLYSGLVMTEVLYYPLAALTLLMIARAIETSSRRDQAIAVALIAAAVLTRTQAVGLAVVAVLAALLDALLARDGGRLRRLWLGGAAIAAAALVTIARPGVFGAYRSTLSGGYPIRDGLGLTWDHLAYLAISVGAMPVAALLLLLVDALRGRERDPRARALIAVTLSATVVILVQVGFFAARFAPHLLGRDLAALPPLFFCVFALWLARGERMPFSLVASAAFVVLATVVLAPWDRLGTLNFLPDTFETAVFARLQPTRPAIVVTIAAVALLTLFAVVPRRLALLLPATVLALLAVNSVIASNVVSGVVRTTQADLLGPTPDWIDQATRNDVTYLYDGEESGIAWQNWFWNHRVAGVLSALPYRFPGPMLRAPTVLGATGRLPITTRYVVATDAHRFVGTPVAHLNLTGVSASGLTLWKLSGRPALSILTLGVNAIGDMTGPTEIDVFDCGGGKLELALLPKETSRLVVQLDGTTVVDRTIANLPYWSGTIDVPRSARPRVCRFTIVPQGLLGSTAIRFVRPS
jgi:hypothetical protein